MAACRKCGSRFNWVSVIHFTFNYSESYIRCYECFSDVKLKPTRRGLLSWIMLVLAFVILFVFAVLAFNAIIPEGRYGTNRPVGEADTIRDTHYSMVRESAGAKILMLATLSLVFILTALSVFIPVKRTIDFISVGFEQKRDGIGFEPPQAE